MSARVPRAAAAALAVAGWAAGAAPTAAETHMELRYAYEHATWSVGALGFAAPLNTFTLIDHDGILLAVIGSMAMTAVDKASSEAAAIRKGETRYSYNSYSLSPGRGVRTAMTVGFGKPSGLAGEAPADAQAFRLDVAGDVAAVGPGVLGWDTGVNYFRAGTQPQPGVRGAPNVDVSSFYLPLGLSYRFGVAGVILEPSAHLDWGYLVMKGFKPGANDLGLKATYAFLPNWRVHAEAASVRAGYFGTQPSPAGQTASLTTLSAGSTMSF